MRTTRDITIRDRIIPAGTTCRPATEREIIAVPSARRVVALLNDVHTAVVFEGETGAEFVHDDAVTE